MRVCIPIAVIRARRTRLPVRPVDDPIRTTGRYNQVVRVASTVPDPAVSVLQSSGDDHQVKRGQAEVKQTAEHKLPSLDVIITVTIAAALVWSTSPMRAWHSCRVCQVNVCNVLAPD
jgi:hypothetical protein